MELHKIFSIFFKIKVSKSVIFEGIVIENSMSKFSIIKGETTKGNKLVYGFTHIKIAVYFNSLLRKTKWTNKQSKIRQILRC